MTKIASTDYTPQNLLVKPRQAAEWLAESIYEGQRKLRSSWIDELKGLMERGQFRQGSTIEFCEWQGRRYLVDGQHRLAAIVATGLVQSVIVVVRRVGAFAEIGENYATYGRELGRSPGDIIKALRLEAEFGLSAGDLAAFLLAVGWPTNGFRVPSGAAKHDLLRRVDQMRNWRATAQLYLELVAPAPRYLARMLRQVPLMSVGLATLLGPAPRAEEFWSGLARDDGLRRDDPRKAIVNHLHNVGKARPLTLVRAVAAAWNHFADGKPLTTIRVPFQGMVGITLKGTAFRARLAPLRAPPPSTASAAPGAEEARP
jgi:hypothetical protein